MQKKDLQNTQAKRNSEFKTLSSNDKRLVEDAVTRVVKEYGKTLELLGRE